MNEQVFLNGVPVTAFGVSRAPALETAFYASPIVGFVGGAFGGYYLSSKISKTRQAAAVGSAVGGVAGSFVLTNLVSAIGKATSS